MHYEYTPTFRKKSFGKQLFFRTRIGVIKIDFKEMKCCLSNHLSNSPIPQNRGYPFYNRHIIVDFLNSMFSFFTDAGILPDT